MIACWNKHDETVSECMRADHLAIIIPFRDEENALPELLHQLKQQIEETPGATLVLVNDHSSDASVHIASEFTKTQPQATLIHQEHTFGKKQGVDLAMQIVTTEWVVTLDADVRIGPQWLRRIASRTHANTDDLLILPLHIGPGTSLIGSLQEVEFASVMGITAGMAIVGEPVLCNGGNLCFRRAAYERVKPQRKDMHIPSGDDLFLLHALKPEGKIKWVHDPLTRVSTQPLHSWKALTAQRLRWMGKTGSMRDPWLQRTAWLTFLTNASLLIGVAAAVAGYIAPAIILLAWCMKVILDGWLIAKVGRWLCIKRLKRFYFLLVFLYPFYATLFPLMSQFIRPSWKGRKTPIR
jgi:cellulose synthase/poly-beta-1,6-N-acetylglucosamine synthase-like glycosyltransferase